MAVTWYGQHLKTSESDTEGLKVVLLTNDQGNKQKAEESGLLVYRCKCLFVRERSRRCIVAISVSIVNTLFFKKNVIVL